MDSIRRFRAWFRGFAKENWGAPFILSFMFLLVVAAVCLTFGMSWWAEQLGVLAYLYLAAGVILQLVCFWKLGPKDESED